MLNLTCGSLFSGCGLGDLGVEWAGFEHRWFCEVDKYARKILAKRWPANLLLDSAAAAVLDEQSGERKSGGNISGEVRSAPFSGKVYGEMGREGWTTYKDTGGASRFFYTAKATKKDRGTGNIHPTVKPTDLMVYLIKLVCPPSGLVLDPFFGSGSTGVAASSLGRGFCGIEREAQYVEIARNRLQQRNPLLLAAGENFKSA